MTETLSGLKQRLIEYLSGLTAFSHCVVLPAYPDRAKSWPADTPVVAVSVAGVELAPSGFGNYLGGEDGLCGAAATVRLRFGIYASGAEACGELFESLCSALLAASWLSTVKIRCDLCAYDAKSASYLLSSEAETKAAWLVTAQEERLFEAIQIKDVTL